MNHHHYHHHDDASGERFIPELMGGQLIDAEHQARYRFAARHVEGKRVLDAGCGVGWGSKLLLEAGASTVVGVDIAEEAVDDARRRAPECEFRLGDLRKLPVGDAEFDVVVCFEALEHVEETSTVLDELIRALDGDGLLFVSSPNPEVYPEGNEFHLNELTPEELANDVATRLPHHQMFRQHQLLASVIHADIENADEAPAFLGWTNSVSGLGSASDVYSLAVASRAPLPEMSAWTSLAPFDQLQQLTEERSTLLERFEDDQARLRDADQALRSVMAERDEAVQRGVDLHTQWEATNLQLVNQRAVADNAARERDDLAARLLTALQRPSAEIQLQELNERLENARARAQSIREERDRLRKKLKKTRRHLRNLKGSDSEPAAAGLRGAIGKTRAKYGRS